MEFLHLFAAFSCPDENWDLKKTEKKMLPASNAYVRRFLRPDKTNIFEINAVKVFPSAV